MFSGQGRFLECASTQHTPATLKPPHPREDQVDSEHISVFLGLSGWTCLYCLAVLDLGGWVMICSVQRFQTCGQTGCARLGLDAKLVEGSGHTPQVPVSAFEQLRGGPLET